MMTEAISNLRKVMTVTVMVMTMTKKIVFPILHLPILLETLQKMIMQKMKQNQILIQMVVSQKSLLIQKEKPLEERVEILKNGRVLMMMKTVRENQSLNIMHITTKNNFFQKTILLLQRFF